MTIAQPAAVSPDFPGFEHNEQRLAAFGALPLVVAVASLLDWASVPDRRGRRRAWLALVALVVASLHHELSVPSLPGLAAFVVLQCGAAIVLAGTIVVGNDATQRREAWMPGDQQLGTPRSSDL